MARVYQLIMVKLIIVNSNLMKDVLFAIKISNWWVENAKDTQVFLIVQYKRVMFVCNAKKVLHYAITCVCQEIFKLWQNQKENHRLEVWKDAHHFPNVVQVV